MIDIQTEWNEAEERFTVTVGPEGHVASTIQHFYVTNRETKDEQLWAAHMFALGAYAALTTAQHLATAYLRPQALKDKTHEPA